MFNYEIACIRSSIWHKLSFASFKTRWWNRIRWINKAEFVLHLKSLAYKLRVNSLKWLNRTHEYLWHYHMDKENMQHSVMLLTVEFNFHSCQASQLSFSLSTATIAELIGSIFCLKCTRLWQCSPHISLVLF